MLLSDSPSLLTDPTAPAVAQVLYDAGLEAREFLARDNRVLPFRAIIEAAGDPDSRGFRRNVQWAYRSAWVLPHHAVRRYATTPFNLQLAAIDTKGATLFCAVHPDTGLATRWVATSTEQAQRILGAMLLDPGYTPNPALGDEALAADITLLAVGPRPGTAYRRRYLGSAVLQGQLGLCPDDSSMAVTLFGQPMLLLDPPRVGRGYPHGHPPGDEPGIHLPDPPAHAGSKYDNHLDRIVEEHHLDRLQSSSDQATQASDDQVLHNAQMAMPEYPWHLVEQIREGFGHGFVDTLLDWELAITGNLHHPPQVDPEETEKLLETALPRAYALGNLPEHEYPLSRNWYNRAERIAALHPYLQQLTSATLARSWTRFCMARDASIDEIRFNHRHTVRYRPSFAVHLLGEMVLGPRDDDPEHQPGQATLAGALLLATWRAGNSWEQSLHAARHWTDTLIEMESAARQIREIALQLHLLVSSRPGPPWQNGGVVIRGTHPERRTRRE